MDSLSLRAQVWIRRRESDTYTHHLHFILTPSPLPLSYHIKVAPTFFFSYLDQFFRGRQASFSCFSAHNRETVQLTVYLAEDLSCTCWSQRIIVHFQVYWWLVWGHGTDPIQQGDMPPPYQIREDNNLGVPPKRFHSSDWSS